MSKLVIVGTVAFDAVETPLLGYIDSDLQTSPNDFNILLLLVEISLNHI